MPPWNAMLDQLLAPGLPLLPSAAAMQIARHLVWACVLCGLTLVPLRFAGARWRRPLAVLLGLWVLIPGPPSPAYWLSLAFQTPSLTSAALCLWLGLAPARAQRSAAMRAGAPHPPLLWTLAGVLLGWVLLLDTFALWPVSVYAWGFETPPVAIAAALAGMPWLLRADAWRWCAAAGLLLLVFVLLRLPSGNLWDALLDPWLWVGLQLHVLRLGLLRLRGAAAAIRV